MQFYAKAIIKKNGDKAAEAFRKGLDHEVTPSRPRPGHRLRGRGCRPLDASRNIENLGLLVGQLAYGSGFGNRVTLRAHVAS
jgi:hypothetical protein